MVECGVLVCVHEVLCAGGCVSGGVWCAIV